MLQKRIKQQYLNEEWYRVNKIPTSPKINAKANTIQFIFPTQKNVRQVCFNGASQVSLAGNFNHWAQDVLLLDKDNDGIWKIDIPMLPDGKYHYKFLVDDKFWMEDLDNPNREPDGVSGFNSTFIIQSGVESFNHLHKKQLHSNKNFLSLMTPDPVF